MAKRIKIGDVLQVLSSAGVSYAQVTHKSEMYGHLLRAFTGFYPKTPKDFRLVVAEPVQFSTFFPVQTAVNSGLFSVVANVPVPENLQPFPTFRSRNGGPGGSIWLWSGGDAVMLQRPLRPDEMKYPIKAIISAPLLVERIEKGYKAETHEIW